MDLDLDLVAEVADGPMVIEELPDGNSLAVLSCVASDVCLASTACVASTECIATTACGAECLGSASTLTCGPCMTSMI